MEKGQALVVSEVGEIVYFYRNEGKYIRTYCGRLIDSAYCRSLDYICEHLYLEKYLSWEVSNDQYHIYE